MVELKAFFLNNLFLLLVLVGFMFCVYYFCTFKSWVFSRHCNLLGWKSKNIFWF